jgi:hypothetical protein
MTILNDLLANLHMLPDHVFSDDEKWMILRSHRSVLLARCDWTQLPDVPFTLAEKEAWATYRQALRDITETFANPDDVEFPEPPDPDALNNAMQAGGPA